MERNIQSVTWGKALGSEQGCEQYLLLPCLVQIALPIADLQKQNRNINDGRIQSTIVDCFAIFFQITICMEIK